MPSIQELRTKMQRISNEAAALYSEMDSKSDKGQKAYEGHSEDIAKHAKMVDEGLAIKSEIELLLKAEELEKFANAPVLPGKNADGQYQRAQKKASMASLFLDSKEYGQNPQAKGANIQFEVDLQKKDLAELTPAEGGALVWSDRLDEIVMKPLRPLSVLNLLRRRPVSTNLVEYRERLTFDNQAAIVPERGVKPKSSHTWGKKSAPIIKVAHYEVTTDEIMDDVPQLRSIVDQDLVEGVLRKLEELVISHNVPTEMVGILNAALGARVHQTASGGLGAATDNPFDTIRYAIADLSMKFYRADSVILNPILAAKFDTAKDGDGRYIMSYDPVVKRMWGLRVAESQGTLIPAGTCIVMDSMYGPVLLDRRVQSLRVGWINDQFITNEFCILAEGRYGLMVQYPDAIEKVTGL